MHELRHSAFRMVLLVAAGVAVGILAISALVWIVGALFHLVPLLVRLGLFVGLVAAVWWLVAGRRRSSRLH
jgi:CHASE2 domain-containing sensor protein